MDGDASLGACRQGGVYVANRVGGSRPTMDSNI